MKMNKVITLDEMRNMPIDSIVAMYRDGYTIEENINNLDTKIVSADVSISTGSLLIIGAGILAYMYIIR